MSAGPGWLGAARAVAAKDLRVEFLRFESLSSAGIFSIVVLVLFHVAFDEAGPEARAPLVPGLIWTVLAFAAVVGMARTFRDETVRDTLAVLLLAPCDRSAIWFGKLLANLARMALLEAVLAPLVLLVFPLSTSVPAAPLAGVLALFGAGLTVLGTLFSAVTARVGRGEALLATLTVPAAAPLLMGAVRCTDDILRRGALTAASDRWLLMGAGFLALYLFLSLAFFEFIVED